MARASRVPLGRMRGDPDVSRESSASHQSGSRPTPCGAAAHLPDEREKQMKRKVELSLIIFFMLIFQLAFASGWDDYKPAKISRVIVTYAESNKDVDFFFTPGIPLRTTVKYLGQTRKTLPERLFFIEKWVKTHGMNPDIIKEFDREILIEEDGNKYWLPIQRVLIPHMNKELKINDKVILFVVLAGAVKTDWVFLINEFNL
jgi:hypothetical protein